MWLEKAGYRIKLINYLNYSDFLTSKKLRLPKRKQDGTGKFYKSFIKKPEVLADVPRNYHRYGILRESVELKLKAIKPSVILISSGMTYWYPGVKEAVETVKKLFPGIPVIVGGTYATLCPEHCDKVVGPDYIITGNALPELSHILKKLSLPYSDLSLTEDFLFLKQELEDSAVIRINTGCPYTCDYCASKKLTGNFKQGNPELTFNNVYQINKKFGNINFAFLDDALLFNKEKGIMLFLEKIIESGLKLNFYLPNAVHLSYLDITTAELMKKAGFREIRIGFESSSDDFHGETGKKLSVEELGRGVRILKSAGFSAKDISVYILAGLPGQRACEVEESIKYASAYRIRIMLAEYSTVPHTKLWKKSVEFSSYPIALDPLTHNNTVFPMEWEHFKLADLERLKKMSHELSVR